MDLQRILGNLGFDWQMALANLVNFLIIFFVLKRYAFKPIKEKLEEREKKIKTGLEDAEKSATEWRMTQQTREKTLFDARKESNEIVGQANEKAEYNYAVENTDSLFAARVLLCEFISPINDSQEHFCSAGKIKIIKQ